MKCIHCAGDIPCDDLREHPVCARDCLFYEILFLCRGRPQDVIYHIIAVTGMSDANTKAIEVGSIDVGHDIAQTIVPAMSAPLLETGYPRWQIDLVVDDEHFLGRIAIIMK